VIYYTIDGSDPRKIGGLTNSTAKEIKTGSSIALQGTVILKSRVKLGSEWSALAMVKFVNANEDYSNLKVTELHYNPADTIVDADTVSSKSFEFIEIKNTGNQAVSLSGLKFTSGVEYEFNNTDVLAPKQFYVIASKPKWFYERHWQVPSGNFEKNFSNSGEQITIATSGGTPVIDFLYSNQNPWVTAPDGKGNSLTSGKVNPTGDPNNYNYWSASSVYDGTPFADDLKVIDAIEETEFTTQALTAYPNPTNGLLHINLNHSEMDMQIEVYSISGSRLYQANAIGNSTIDFKQFNVGAGVYLLNIRYEHQTAQIKVVYRP